MKHKHCCGRVLVVVIVLLAMPLCVANAENERTVFGRQGSVAYFMENGLIGLMDEERNIRIPPRFSRVEPFCFGYARVIENGQQALIREDGRYVVQPCDWWNIGVTSTNIYPSSPEALMYNVKTPDAAMKVGYLTLDGDALSDTLWTSGKPFMGGCAIVEQNGMCNLLRLNGELLTQQWWQYIARVGTAEPYLYIVKAYGKWGGQ